MTYQTCGVPTESGKLCRKKARVGGRCLEHAGDRKKPADRGGEVVVVGRLLTLAEAVRALSQE
jgi:hypothetical protein